MIYVVDDNELNVELLVTLLEDEGYAVRGYTNPKAAWEAVLDSPPELLLLDVVMPELDGITFCRRVKTELVGFFPVILITAQNDTVFRHKGLDAGADDFITKPFDRIELLIKVRNFLRTKEMYDQLQQNLDQTNHQMNLAGQMQRSLFVPAERELQGPSYVQLYYPARFLSGDVIHIHQNTSGAAFFFIADVAGHGVSSSLLAGAVKILVSDILHQTVVPSEVLYSLNQSLANLLDTSTAGYYVTAIGCLLTEKTLSISAAGHPPALASFANRREEFGQAGLPLGIFADQEYETTERSIEDLDWLLLFTDGLAECIDLNEISADEAGITQLRASLAQQVEGPGLSDDVTALMIWRR